MSHFRISRSATAALLLAILVFAVPSLAPSAGASSIAGAGTGTDAVEAPALTTGLLRVRIDTTSDWSTVTFSGRLGGLRMHTQTGAGEVRRLSNGLLVRGVASSASLVFDVVLEDASSRTASWINTEKGQRGALRVQIENRTGEPYVALDGRNDVQTSLDGRYRKIFPISRERLFGADDLELPRAQVDPKVLAFYYPWFDAAAYDDPTLADRPVGPADVWSYDDVLSMTSQARAAGIDGFVVSWAGAAANGAATKLVLRAAANTGGVAAGLLETAGANQWNDPTRPPEADVVERYLRELIMYTAHPSYLRVDGIPVVVVYEMRQLPPRTWREILDRLAAQGAPVRLVGDAGPAWGSVAWGAYEYSPWGNDDGPRSLEQAADDIDETAFQARARSVTHPVGGPPLVAATVYPGYDDRNLRGDDRPVVERDGTATYDALWAAAHDVEADWVFITSWNEWYEGTSIQPGREEGRAALDATGAHAAGFKAG